MSNTIISGGFPHLYRTDVSGAPIDASAVRSVARCDVAELQAEITPSVAEEQEHHLVNIAAKRALTVTEFKQMFYSRGDDKFSLANVYECANLQSNILASVWGKRIESQAAGVLTNGQTEYSSGPQIEAVVINDGFGAGGELAPFGSQYLTGFVYEKPLADLRGDLEELGIARADGVTVHGCYNRHPAVLQARVHSLGEPDVLPPLFSRHGALRMGLEVGPHAERPPARASQDRRPDVVFPGKPAEDLDELVHHLPVVRIQDFRAIEGNGCHSIDKSYFKVFFFVVSVVHCFTP